MKWPVCISHVDPSQGQTTSQKHKRQSHFLHSGDDSCNAFCAARSNRQLAASKRFPTPSRRPKRRILCPQSNGHETSRQGTALPGYGLFCFQIKTLDAHPKANSSSRLPSAHQSDHPARTGRCGNPKQRPERDSRRDRVPNPKRRHTVRRDGPDAPQDVRQHEVQENRERPAGGCENRKTVWLWVPVPESVPCPTRHQQRRGQHQ